MQTVLNSLSSESIHSKTEPQHHTAENNNKKRKKKNLRLLMQKENVSGEYTEIHIFFVVVLLFLIPPVRSASV